MDAFSWANAWYAYISILGRFGGLTERDVQFFIYHQKEHTSQKSHHRIVERGFGSYHVRNFRGSYTSSSRKRS